MIDLTTDELRIIELALTAMLDAARPQIALSGYFEDDHAEAVIRGYQDADGLRDKIRGLLAVAPVLSKPL